MKKLLIFVLLTIVLLLPAIASDSGQILNMHVSDSQVTIMTGFTRDIKLTFTPENVQVGIDCGMPDMCGMNPCTCGSSDQWGSCSCNGLKTVSPNVQIISDNDAIAQVNYQNGIIKIAAKKTGQAKLILKASLPHYQEASCSIDIMVKPIPILWWAAGTAILLGVAAVFFFVRRWRNNPLTKHKI